MYWDFNNTHITFEVHVETKGYVGFGFSPNGQMVNSDVVIGWVKDGHTYFSVSRICHNIFARYQQHARIQRGGPGVRTPPEI